MKGRILWAWLTSLVVLYAPGSVVVGQILGGPFTFLTVWVIYFSGSVFDLVFGRAKDDSLSEELECSRGFDSVVVFCGSLQLLMVAGGVWAVLELPLTTLEKVGLTVSLGLSSGALGVNVGHELIHSSRAFSRRLGMLVLCSICYGHFAPYHVYGHHLLVATPQDPATARRGESVYGFLRRVLRGTVRLAWDVERRRLEKRGRGPWSLRNEVLWSIGSIPVLVAGLGFGLGWEAAALFAGQAAVAIAVHEVVQYTQHYGLVRREIAPGRFEKIGPGCAWDASQRLSNWALFNMPRHADHHLHAARPFQALRLPEGAPRMPAGYATMILIALVPPLWRRVMDPRLPQEAAARAAA